MSRQETITRAAGDSLGCPYVYGAWGAKCTPALRRKYLGYHPEKTNIVTRCPVLSNKQKTCAGCKYEGKLAFDCRGFTHWCLKQAGIAIEGQAVGSQWNAKNWDEKGDIEDMPDLVCCVFIKDGDTWSHTGLHVGGGKIIHCSGEVKTDRIGGSRKWNYYGIPKGLYTAEERAAARKGKKMMRILRKGCEGEDVRGLQELLNQWIETSGTDYPAAKLTEDGKYGSKTLAAVAAFQEASGLKVDGVAGEETQEALAAFATPPAGAEPDPDPEEEEPEEAEEITGVTEETEYEEYEEMLHFDIPMRLVRKGVELIRELLATLES